MIKNTASQRVGVQMITAADGSAFTGSVTVAVTVDAGTQATGSVGSGACTHEGNGYHTYAPAQAETNGDLVAFTFTGTGAVPQTVQVYTRAATPDVNVTTIEGSDATNQIRDAVVDDATRIDASALNTHSAITAASIVNEWESQSQADPTGFHVNVLEIGGTAQTANDNGADINAILVDTADMQPKLGTPAADLAADIAAVKSQTAAIETDTQDLQTQVGTDGAGLTALPWNANWDTEVQSEVTDALNAYDPPTNTEMEARTLAAASYATASALQTVDDEIATIDGNVDLILVDTGTTLQGELDAIQAAVITNAAGTDIAADIIAIKAETAAILADTNELQTDDTPGALAALDAKLDTIDDFLDTEVAAILADTNELQGDWANGGRLDLLIDAIKAVTDLLTASNAEPTGVPAADATPLVKLATVYMMLRNKVTVTASKKTFFGDDDAAEFEKDLSDNGTTYTESEVNAI